MRVDSALTSPAPRPPGCHSQGDTRDEALANFEDAIITDLRT